MRKKVNRSLCGEQRKRKLLVFLLFLFLSGISGSIWQRVMVRNETKKYPAVGNFADVGSYKLHYVLKGEGDVAVVFIEGSGTPCAYTDFYYLQEEMSKSFVTLSYDRAGTGWSEETEESRNINQLTKEICQLIDLTVDTKQVILICHSLGSLEAINFAQTYPDRVKGIVFLDSGSPEFYKNDSELSARALNIGNSFLRMLGVNRFLGEIDCFLPVYGESDRHNELPDDIKEVDEVMYYRYAGNPAVRTYVDAMNENAEVVCNGNRLGKIPVLVLSSDTGDSWTKVQKELAAWSENSTQITLSGSGHYLHHTNREEVMHLVDECLQLLLCKK